MTTGIPITVIMGRLGTHGAADKRHGTAVTVLREQDTVFQAKYNIAVEFLMRAAIADLLPIRGPCLEWDRSRGNMNHLAFDR